MEFTVLTSSLKLPSCNLYLLATRCEFWVNATHPDLDDTARTKGRTGHVISPRHTLPPNTTCTYHFRGQAGRDMVWLYFLTYAHRGLQPNTTHNCSTRLRIWDGGKIIVDVTLHLSGTFNELKTADIVCGYVQNFIL